MERLVLALTAILALGRVLNAASGDLDASFGTGGRVILTLGERDDWARGLALQEDGKFVVCGYTKDQFGASRFFLIRLAGNGILDPSFNGTGKVLPAAGGPDTDAYAVKVQPDGKIVVVGTVKVGTSTDIALWRFNPDGTPDTTFNGTGSVVTAIGAWADVGSDLELLPGGKILVGGWGGVTGANGDFALLRYDGTGTLDTTFRGTGIVTTPIGTSVDNAFALFVQPDGKIVLAGGAVGGSIFQVGVARYHPDGGLDTSLWNTGKRIVSIAGTTEFAYDVIAQPDGKLVLAGLRRYGSTIEYALIVRLTEGGALDPTFNGNGTVAINFKESTLNSYFNASALALQNNGKILVAGGGLFDGGGGAPLRNAFHLFRFNQNGTFDTTFQGTGWVGTHGNPDSAYGLKMELQKDGKVVMAGLVTVGGYRDLMLVRYQAGPYETWKYDRLGHYNVPDDGNNDSDAFVTLAEYGLVLDPAAYSAGPEGGPHAYAEGTRLRMVFTRDPARNDVTIEAEVADEMAGPWTVVASSVLGAPMSGPGYVGGDSAGAGLKMVEVRDVVNVGDAAHPRRYLRLRVKR